MKDKLHFRLVVRTENRNETDNERFHVKITARFLIQYCEETLCKDTRKLGVLKNEGKRKLAIRV